MPSLGMQNSMAASLDVVISVGFVRSIVVTEAKRRKDWNTNAELDSIKAVVTAMVPATGYQAEGFLSSGPLESPKKVGEIMKYNAIFPLKSRDSNGVPTRITLPGLMQRDKNVDNEDFPSPYKRQTVELLITLVLGNEAITLGKTTLLVTGEEVKTKQSDLPIDTDKKSVIQLKKKSTFHMKRSSSISSNKQGEIAPTSFKYDRRRRKYQIEKDAVLRAYVKCVPHNPYGQQINAQGGMGPVSQQYNENHEASTARTQSGIPKVISPGMGFEPSMGGSGSVYSTLGLNSVTGSYGRGNDSSPVKEYSDHNGRTFQEAGSRPQSNSRIHPYVSMHNSSHGRTPPPSHLMTHQRSSSAPRQRSGAAGGHGSAYGGSSYNGSHADYSFSGTGTRGRSVSRGSSHQQYGGSSYGTPSRKPNMHQGSQYGGSHFNRAGVPQPMRSPSPEMFTRQY